MHDGKNNLTILAVNVKELVYIQSLDQETLALELCKA